MTITVTGKLNKPARQHPLDGGASMFFVDIGRQVYNRKLGEKEWVNYSAGLYAKDNQATFYAQTLIEGAVVSISAPDVLLDMPDNPEYKPRLNMVDAKLEFVFSSNAQPQQAAPMQQAPQQPQQGFHNPPQGQPMQQPQQMAPQQQPMQPQQPAGFNSLDDNIAF